MNLTKNSIHFISTKTVIFVTIIVLLTVIIGAYFLSIKSHHTLYENSLIILITLAISLFVFITVGLYYGIKLKENIGKLTDHIDFSKLPDINGASIPDFGAADEGIVGVLLAILTAIILMIFAWIFILTSWYLLILISAMLYWVYFRALRLVFKNSTRCKGDIATSLKYGSIYSFLYTSWIFVIILSIHFFIK